MWKAVCCDELGNTGADLLGDLTASDPFLHAHAPLEVTKRQFRQKFSDACYGAPRDERLVDFFDVVRSDDASAIAAVGSRLSGTLPFHRTILYPRRYSGRSPDAVFRYSERRVGR